MKPLLVALSIPALLLGACRAEPPKPSEEASTPAANAVPAQAPAAAQAAFPELTGRVVDEADLLTDAQEARLDGDLAAIEQRTSDQFVVVTVPTLGGRPIADYARDLGNGWGLGQAEHDNGVLMLVAPAERMTRIAVGYGLEPILTNARTQVIIDQQMVPRFRERNWYGGIATGVAAIAAILVEHEGEPRRGRP